jgi:hypothetical protein
MRSIYTKKFSWLRTPTAWQQSQIWRERRQAMNAKFFQKSNNFIAGLAVAQADQISGTAQIVSQMAVARIQAEAKAKFDSLDKVASDIQSNIKAVDKKA